MKKIPWYHRLRFQVMTVLVILVIIPILIFWNYTQWNNREQLLQQSAASTESGLSSAALMLQNTMEEVRDYSRQISEDEEFLSDIRDFQHGNTAGEDTEVSRARLSLAMGEYVSDLRSLDSIYLYFTDSHILVTMLPEQKVFTEGTSYSQAFRQLYYNQLESSLEWTILNTPDSSASTLSLIRLIPSSNTRKSCLLICNLKDSAWQPELLRITEEDQSLLITDYNGNALLQCADSHVRRAQTALAGESAFEEALASSENSGSYLYTLDGESCQITYYNAVETGWKYMMLIPESGILGPSSSLSGVFYLLLFLSALLCILLGSLLLNHTVMAPIRRIVSYMERTEGGVLEEAAAPIPSGEMGLLFHSYNHMIRRLRELIDQVYIQQLLREQTQLNYLQSQMDEHFLFNILNTIYSESCHESAPATGRMVLTLSRYFRRSLSYGQEKLPLNEIAELLALYLQLQRMRYGHNLQCKIETFPGMERYTALKYLFQPIVENAIVHGFEKNPEGHRIQIIFRREEDELYFEVNDDGIGIREEELTALLQEVNRRKTAASDKGFALRNIHEQIALTYGERPIHIESTYGSGTRVCFRIPLEERKETTDHEG